MTRAFTGKVALVIGGTRGIGAAISRQLAADGAAVAMIHRSRSGEADALLAELQATGADALTIAADVGDPVALNDAIDTVIARFGRLDILINNAGLAITGPLADYPPDAFDRVFAVNVRAPFLAAQKAAGVMTQGGRIITIGSIVADRMPGAGGTLYAASKAALAGMTRGLARDLGDRGITANLVQPGPIDTERNPADGPNAEANRSPLAIRRHGSAEEVAVLVAYLASGSAGFVTGAVYNIDGGWSA
ncbi:SDR family NAD(P)-dependent oxidoreductase [Sphingomonas sp. MMS24-J13]|uniref:SDR family NAD(P)-dependent oxidoreductase n=1 Tax=Sphingomonas sp. MMS24-J13 TaxID=3238686 RepID=UPI00384BCB9A